MVYRFCKVLSHCLHKIRKILGKPLCSCQTLSGTSLFPPLPEIVFMLLRCQNIQNFNSLLEYFKSTKGLSLPCLTSRCLSVHRAFNCLLEYMNTHLQCQVIISWIWLKCLRHIILMAGFIRILNLLMNWFLHHFLRYLISYRSWCYHSFLFLLCALCFGLRLWNLAFEILVVLLFLLHLLCAISFSFLRSRNLAC